MVVGVSRDLYLTAVRLVSSLGQGECVLPRIIACRKCHDSDTGKWNK